MSGKSIYGAPAAAMPMNGLGAHSISPPDEAPSERGMDIILSFYEANLPEMGAGKASITVCMYVCTYVCMYVCMRNV